MTAKPVINAADAESRVRAGANEHVKVGLFDIDGLLRGKFMHRDKFSSALSEGFGFCDVVLGWDSNDELYDNTALTGWDSGWPDATVRIVPDTGRQIPFEGDRWLFLAEFTGAAEAVCPRGVLRRVLARADEMGYRVNAGFEYEFFVFAETPHSIRDKNYRDLRPVTPGSTGYSMLRTGALDAFYKDILDTCSGMDIPLEGLHEEMGPGVVEGAIMATDGLAAADRAALFKTMIKILAQRHGLMATFMAKWSEQQAGQSGHIHLSLTRKSNGLYAFHDPSADGGMSEVMRHFIGGQQRLMPEMTVLAAPTVNSYSRLVPDQWAPTEASWGIDNRTCALRVVPGAAESLRVEYRVPGSDANPYLALAGAVASGLYGIEQEIAPTAPVTGNAREAEWPAELTLPRTLAAAADSFSQSSIPRDWLGDTFVDHFAASRDWEVREFRKHVTDWELARYFEMI
ncbi:MAG: glutamine synthetase [Alphaproteobacteria bacterium]|nr:glutamine synthetase [Alphaproteobacteria bacterium]